MVDVKPDEISAILKQQLSGFQSAAELEEVGTVLQVGDGIARVYGLNGSQAGELVEFETGVRAIVLNLEEDNVGVVLLGPGDGIVEGSTVRRTKRIASIEVGDGFRRPRVVDPLGSLLTVRVP
jgi:F-type H+-transporting ATPase subunit alpha